MSDLGTTVETMFESLGYMLGGLFIMLSSILVPLLFCLCCRARIARKMGDPFWFGFVPVLNDYLLFQRLWAKPRLFFLYAACAVFSVAVPILGTALMAPIYVIMRGINYWKLGAAFGRGVIFRLGLIFLTPLFLGVLAFSANTYVQPMLGYRTYQKFQQDAYWSGFGPKPTPRLSLFDLIWFI